MKIAALPAIFLAGMSFAPPLPAQQGGAGPASSRSSVPSSAPATSGGSDEILARTYMATKRYREAGEMYRKLAKAHPRDPSYLNLAGIAYMQMGDLRSARSWFERCIKLEPRFADAHNNLGATWYTQKNFKRALEYYRRAVALQPGVAGFHTNVGYAYFSLKMPLEAEQAFKRALLMDPFVFQQNDRTGSVLQDRSVDNKGLFAFTMAKSYAGANDAAHCANYLRRALDEGFPDISKVYTDPAFAPLLADPGMQAVLSLIPAASNEAALPSR